ncbi:MAG: Smr/MutS family protein [Syntrophomonadaceae bacterium]|nr:Smr/MutS family protein [Syntrophomonadaceae bacterium]
MKIEQLNLHGHNLLEAKQKLENSLTWCLEHQVDMLDINHGKGHHSERGFSVIKSEVRQYLKQSPLIKKHSYSVIPGESNLPAALQFDEGHTLVVKKGLENTFLGGRRQQEKHQAVFSKEGRQQRKQDKQIRAEQRKRNKSGNL